MTNSPLTVLRKQFKTKEEEILEDFFTFLRIPSISSEPDYRAEVRACSDWLVEYLQSMGFKTQVWPTKGHPVVFASHLQAGSDKPTLLIYNHYDVQPVDPLEEWETPPFEPHVRNGQVYARGAQDNKGQCFYTLQGLKLLLEKDGKFPINIKLCIEGEEECGSVSLPEVLKAKKKELKADYLAIVDLSLRDANTPAITLGTRGLITMDLTVEGAKSDAHSGSNGGLLYNPIHALVEILSKLRDTTGKITIPGFYDDVVSISEKERAKYSFILDENQYQADFGVKPTGGEKAFSAIERAWIRPTLEINGIVGGYTGQGFKTVIPAKASAKISCRLVPNQHPDTIGKAVSAYIEKLAPAGISVKVNLHVGRGKPVRADANSKVVQAFAQAYSEVFEKPCEFILEGASIPIIPELTEASEAQVVLIGLGLQDDQIHAPNEHFGIDRIEKGALIIARSIELLGG
jgi:acetylornithine deacetylase/succinyl-diaminopimelate desuccinylase-like protein